MTGDQWAVAILLVLMGAFGLSRAWTRWGSLLLGLWPGRQSPPPPRQRPPARRKRTVRAQTPEEQRLERELILHGLRTGRTPAMIARVLAGDPRNTRRRIYRMARQMQRPSPPGTEARTLIAV